MAAPSKTTLLSKVWKRIFGPRFRTYLLENKYKVEPAFSIGGVAYYHFTNQEEAPAGRQFAALAVYQEMDMRMDKEYIEMHVKVVEKLLSDPKKINIGLIAQLNYNMKDRLGLMMTPDYVYKLASVVFFDKTESPYNYDFKYNRAKIEKWKKEGATLDFFLQTPLRGLVPSLTAQEDVSSVFSRIAEQVMDLHKKTLTDILEEQ